MQKIRGSIIFNDVTSHYHVIRTGHVERPPTSQFCCPQLFHLLVCPLKCEFVLIRICVFKSSDGIATNVQLHAVEYFVDYRLSMDIKIVRQILTSANRNDMILPTTK